MRVLETSLRVAAMLVAAAGAAPAQGPDLAPRVDTMITRYMRARHIRFR